MLSRFVACTLCAWCCAHANGRAHFGLECDTFSHLNQGVNHRRPESYFMGESEKAYQANLLVHHMVAVMYLLRRRYPHVVFTLENPADTLASHPLMAILEAPVGQGGLGLRLAHLSYCVYGKEFPPKPTYVWTDSEQLYDNLMQRRAEEGGVALERWPQHLCRKHDCDCGSFGKHGAETTRRGVRGNASIYNTERYPDKFCGMLADKLNQEVHDR